MKRTVIYTFEQNDPPWPNSIDEAFNRIAEFTPELRQQTQGKEEPPAVQRSLNRITKGNQFDSTDVRDLCDYAAQVHKRIQDKYQQGELAAAPWAESVLQAGEHLVRVLRDLAQFMEG